MTVFIGKGHLDRERARAMMDNAQLDALLLIQPESICYATGADPGNATKTRRLGPAMLLIPANPAEAVAMIIGDYYADGFKAHTAIEDLTSVRIWVDTADIRASSTSAISLRERLSASAAGATTARPSSFERTEVLAAMTSVLAKRGMADARIGTEMAFLPHADAGALFNATPNVRWSDATGIVTTLRAIKAPREVALLGGACAAAEAGLEAVRLAFRDQVPGHVLQSVWEMTTIEAARKAFPAAHVSTWASIQIGPELNGTAAPVSRGDLVKCDVGCVIDGYSSDGARTFSLGRPSEDAKEVFRALHDAQKRAIEAMQIGTPCHVIFTAAQQSMVRAGFPTFNRGHFGHSLGASLFVEEAPFFSSDETFAIAPDMVVAIEAPWYIKGLGAVMIEDPFLVTADGPRPLWRIDADLIEL